MKLQKFKKTQKNNTKNIFISLVVIIVILSVFVVYKSYAIYKLEKKYDIIQSKVGTFPKGDLQVSVLVDGQETNTFPTYQDNYYVESINCTNGVEASFDVENWQINIADMSATSTKCTISFDSTKTNSVTPVNMSKTELLALNESLTTTTFNTLKSQILDATYPVGSIYLTTTEDTVAKVQNKLGGTWEKFAEGKTLISADSTYPINTTGGSATINLSHSHTVNSHSHTIGGNTGSTTLTAAQSGLPAHSHSMGHLLVYIPGDAGKGAFTVMSNRTPVSGDALSTNNNTGLNATQGHTHTLPANTGAASPGTDSQLSATQSILQPYATTYMYKRVS